jgi:hypothetical protein
MCNRTKNNLRMLPTLILSGGLFVGAVMKLTAIHPMMPHFTQMGLTPYVTGLGWIELFFTSLFLYRKTVKLGLLLLTGYFGGAMAAEIPYHMIAAPAMALLFIWIAAYLRMPELFIEKRTTYLTTAKS